MLKTTIIIPTYNEVENIGRLTEKIFSLDVAADLKVIIVDDNSPDGTAEITKAMEKKYPLRTIVRKRKLGIGSAYRMGFQQALKDGAEAVMEMDADFSHNPEDIPRLMLALNKGADLAIGSRRVRGGDVRGWNFWRNLQSKCAMFFARKMLNLKTRDITAGFRCYRASLLNKINFQTSKSDGYAFQEEMIFLSERAGAKISEVAVTFVDRKLGKSKLGLKDIAQFFITIFRLKIADKKTSGGYAKNEEEEPARKEDEKKRDHNN